MKKVSPPPQAILAAAQEGRFVIEDFTPLADSLEWTLGQQYWRERGSKAFTGESIPVPFVINNDGNMSRHSADLVFASLFEAEKTGTSNPITPILLPTRAREKVCSGVVHRRRAVRLLFPGCVQSHLCTKKARIMITGFFTSRADACRKGIFANHPGRYHEETERNRFFWKFLLAFNLTPRRIAGSLAPLWLGN